MPFHRFRKATFVFKWNSGSVVHTILTCDLGFDLSLHLQRVHEDAAVADEAGAGYPSVRLAEALFIKVVPETERERFKDLSTGVG